MPETYIREMIADWMGASKAYTGSWDMGEWLTSNWKNLSQNMHYQTENRLHSLLIHELGYFMYANIWKLDEVTG